MIIYRNMQQPIILRKGEVSFERDVNGDWDLVIDQQLGVQRVPLSSVVRIKGGTKLGLACSNGR